MCSLPSALINPMYVCQLMQVVNNSPCKSNIAGTALCLYGPDSNCCSAVQQWNDDKCWCSPAGRTILGSLPPVAGTGMLVGLGRMCDIRSNIRCT